MFEFAEAVEFLHYVVAGSNANDILLELLPVACRKEGRENKIDRQCLETSFLFNIEEILGHLPQLKSYVMGLFLTDPQALARFIENLEETVCGPNI